MNYLLYKNIMSITYKVDCWCAIKIKNLAMNMEILAAEINLD